jgi:cell wall-associated NlpC family hydrolase
MTKVWIIVGVAVGLVCTLILVTVTVTTVVNTQQQALSLFRMSSCNAAIGPWADATGDAAAGEGQAARLNNDQRGIAAQIIQIGKQRQLPPLAWQVAIQAGMQESSLTNVGRGDAAGPDSRGIFQMRFTMGWGTEAQLLDPVYEINKFYDVLTKIPNWQQLRPGDAAQLVEHSAFPDAYAKWEALAAELIKTVGDVADPSGCGQQASAVSMILPANQAAAKAIAYAELQLGKPYIWGGNGPVGYDCSGLVQQAYLAAGIQLPRVAADQYHAGAMLPVQQAQPGDLVFLATDKSNPATIHHVAMYLGDHKIIEAQDFGIPIHVRPFSFTEAEVVPQAVRPGV